MSSLLLFVPSAAAATPIPAEADRSTKIVRKWTLPGQARGIAVDSKGRLYVGLADRQSVVRINPSNDMIEREVVLDSPEIASTKDLVVLRIDTAGDDERLLTANGSDESATILSLPDLAVEREITLEGEVVRDIQADPLGQFLYVLGRDVHIYDREGDREIRTVTEPRPMAMAVSTDGRLLAIAGSETIAGITVTTLGLWSTSPLREQRRIPLQTDEEVVSLSFAAGNASIIAATPDSILQLTLSEPVEALMTKTGEGMRTELRPSDLISSDRICLPERAGPQIITLGPSGNEILFPEKRCGVSGTITGSPRLVSIESLYGIDAYAIAWDPTRNAVFASRGDSRILLYKYEPKGDRR